MWKVTEHKSPKGQQDLRVTILLKEVSKIEWITISDQFIEVFEDRILKIPRTNIYAAHWFNKLTPRNYHSLELWKLDAQGEFKEKLYTLTYQKDDKS